MKAPSNSPCSPMIRRSFRRAERIRRMSAMHWSAYICFRPQLIHKGGKP